MARIPQIQEETTKIAPRPSSPTAGDKFGSVRPYEVDPELATIKIAEILINKLGTPSIVPKPFIVRFGIFHALNHADPGYNKELDEILENPTGYDSSLRLAAYRKFEAGSINFEGRYFNNVWAYLMKPKYIIQGMGGMPASMEEEQKESVLSRFVGWMRGGKKNEPNTN